MIQDDILAVDRALESAIHRQIRPLETIPALGRLSSTFLRFAVIHGSQDAGDWCERIHNCASDIRKSVADRRLVMKTLCDVRRRLRPLTEPVKAELVRFANDFVLASEVL